MVEACHLLEDTGKKHPGCTEAFQLQVCWMERGEEEFHPHLCFPDPCSLAVILGSCFRALCELLLYGSIWQKETVMLCRVSKTDAYGGGLEGEKHIPVVNCAWKA